MTSLEDKILGEKSHYYCSSDEEDESNSVRVVRDDVDKPPPCPPGGGGGTTNTGPKGVITDWREYKKMLAEARSADEQERLEQLQKMSSMGKTKAEDEKARADAELEAELAELMNDESILAFQRQRVLEITAKMGVRSTFGQLIRLQSAEEFLQAVEEEQHSTVIVHIFENNVPACRRLNQCLEELAKEMPTVKFCSILSSHARVSLKFRNAALPTILAYKKNQIIGNFVQLVSELGDDFCSSDVENFLIERGIIVEKEIQYNCYQNVQK
ncbi:phosducin-like protein [Phlebotomus argentipes]|uniref:phosducin-like protein n=1 Tax=Phlebotomus argentipes TaxID=94469 RepID=UPI002892B51A|nr:phosducin-like protein [Phlebotomus argentipes]